LMIVPLFLDSGTSFDMSHKLLFLLVVSAVSEEQAILASQPSPAIWNGAITGRSNRSLGRICLLSVLTSRILPTMICRDPSGRIGLSFSAQRSPVRSVMIIPAMLGLTSGSQSFSTESLVLGTSAPRQQVLIVRKVTLPWSRVASTNVLCAGETSSPSSKHTVYAWTCTFDVKVVGGCSDD
jgi:hypothetical protein